MLVKPKIKYIQTLGQKKFREQERLFIAEGPKLVKELSEAGTVFIKEIYAVKEWIDDNKRILDKKDVTEITSKELEKISQLTTPNKVLAIVQQYDPGKIIIVKDRITLALDNIQDPGNLGTIIRIADWFGVEQIVCSQDSADMYNPKVVQSTMGSIARVKVFYTDLNEWLADQKGITIYAASLNGDDVTMMEKIKEGIIIFGNESKGISDELLNIATKRITIPKKGKAESLNVAVAVGVVMGCVL